MPSEIKLIRPEAVSAKGVCQFFQIWLFNNIACVICICTHHYHSKGFKFYQESALAMCT